MLALFAVGFGQISYPELQFPDQKLGLVTHIQKASHERLNMTVIQCLGNMLNDRLRDERFPSLAQEKMTLQTEIYS